MKINLLIVWVISALLLACSVSSATDAGEPGWLAKVPPTDHTQKNPVRRGAAAIAQGHNTFRAHCAQCHGPKAEGSERAPALTTRRVQRRATEGDLHWLLVNGNKERGMPAWAKLGDLEIWQVIGYVRSLK